METTELSYPVFEPNQVLSDAHLNDMFEYLDEQSRLTRANLIGIGIVCGLEVRLDAPGTVRVSRGCGVTSQGYLMVEPDDLALTHVREYRLPGEEGYGPFTTQVDAVTAQIPLWELFADDDEPGAVPLEGSGIPLIDKAVVLLLELRHDRTRVCGPDDCDDRGGAMSTTVRRLLVDVADLDRLNAIDPAQAPGVLGGDIAARVGLPDLRMPRFDVPNESPVTAENVLAAFSTAFRRNALASSTASALEAMYRAFAPIVRDEFPGDPFSRIRRQFAFLDTAPLTTGQAVFLQYYWDFFDDLLAAYDELRWKGVDLLCACCPPEGLFPRHLTLGTLHPGIHPTGTYRHRFVPSPAVTDCAPRTRAVRTLFRRLVAMVRDFTEGAPSKGVRVTPSTLRAPLSHKAIPYYYVPAGSSPALHDTWDPVRSEHGRPNQNLGYRSDEYPPPVPVFVTDPLRFDLEPYDFFRIEGHLGRDVHSVLETLLAERKRSRLPMDVIALRAGAFDETIDVDLDDEDCSFEDLDTLYATLVAELRCFLVKQVEYFYDIPVAQVDAATPVIAPRLSLLRTMSPTFRAAPGTVGSRIEGLLAWEPGRDLPFNVSVGAVPDLQSQALRLVSALSDLAELLTDRIGDLDFASMRSRYAAIVQIAKEMEGARRDKVFDPIALAGRLDDIVYRCRLDPFEALEHEYRRRIREVKQAQFLSHFLERHPGIQHKAGVPLGGTFILVYQEKPGRPRVPRPPIDVGAVRGDLRDRLLDRFDIVTAPPDIITPPVAPVRPDFEVRPDIAVTPDIAVNPDIAVRPDVNVRPDLNVRPGLNVRPDIAVRPDLNVRRDATIRSDAAAAQPDLDVVSPRRTPGISIPSVSIPNVIGAAEIPLRESVVPDAGRLDNLAALLDRIVGSASLAANPDVQKLSREWLGLAPALGAVRPRGENRVIQEAVSRMADGTVIADFFLPYVIRSHGAAIQYQLPPTRLKVTATKGCTGSDGAADVQLKVDGASGALSIKVDDGAFAESEGMLRLPVGEHTVVVRDATGNEAPPLQIRVPSQLVITSTEVAVDDRGATYQVVAVVQGGTPPYFVDPAIGTIVEGAFTSVRLKAGEPLALVVTDTAGCRVEATVESGATPCDLPCGGEAIQHSHRFWLPEPRRRFPIKEVSVEVQRFEVTGPDGQFDLTGEVADLARRWTGPLSAGDFAAIVGRWLAGVGKVVAGAVGSDKWFGLEYVPAPEGGDAVGSLRVERLACLDYVFELVVTFVPGGREEQWRQRHLYHPGGAVFSDEVFDGGFEMEPFDIATGNKCDPEPMWNRVCEGANLELDFRYISTDGEVGFILQAVHAGDPVRTFVWELPDGLPPTQVGEQIEGRFASFEPTVKQVRVTAYTERGCTVSVAREIDLTQREG